MKVLWIDDDLKREERFNSFKEKFSLNESKFCLLDEQSDLDILIKNTVKNKYDLIVIDERLTNFKKQIDKGSILSDIFIKKNVKSFIVGITADSNSSITDTYEKEPYNKFIEESKFFFEINDIVLLAEDYRILNRLKSTNSIVEKVFNRKQFDCCDNLISVIPKQVKNDFSSPISKKNLYQWMEKIFFSRAGFLYDELWLATFLGLKPKSLPKVQKFFSSALYSGLFALESKPYWWVDKVKDILVVNEKIFSEPLVPRMDFWERGRLLNGVTKGDFSKCEMQGNDHPETVAYIDDSLKNKAQVKYAYTKQSINSESIKFFEDIRIYDDGLV